jgi:indoleacetamide hydrolase
MKRRTCLHGLAAAAIGTAAPAFRSARSDSNDSLEMSATDAIRAIESGEVQAEVYAERLLRHCETMRGLNAITWLDAAAVLSKARAVDQARKRGERLDALAGLPLLIKDNIDTLGFPSSAATPSLKSNFPKKNAPVIDALLGKGAIVLAKANMAELALSATSSESAFGSVHNPYSSGRFSGGSSGGTAAGLAARLAPAGLGTDTAGSGRIPAAVCGVVGLRPTTQPSRVYANSGIVPLASLLDTVAPMARTVRDVALLHGVMAGVAVPEARPLVGVRLGIARRFLWDDLEPEVARVTEQAIARLRDAGAQFIEVDLGDIPEASWSLQRTMMLVGMKQDLDAYLRDGGSSLSAADVLAGIQAPAVAALFKTAASLPLTPEKVAEATGVQAPALRKRFDAVLREKSLSAIVYPSVAISAQAIKLPTDSSPWIVNGKEVGQQMLSRNTRMSAALGTPALALPCGLTADGLPVSLEFNAAGTEDLNLLALCQAVETVLGRLPPPRLS